jgi:hypothetical protein
LGFAVHRVSIAADFFRADVIGQDDHKIRRPLGGAGWHLSSQFWQQENRGQEQRNQEKPASAFSYQQG